MEYCDKMMDFYGGVMNHCCKTIEYRRRNHIELEHMILIDVFKDIEVLL